MRPDMIVLPEPDIDDRLRLMDRTEPLLSSSATTQISNPYGNGTTVWRVLENTAVQLKTLNQLAWLPDAFLWPAVIAIVNGGGRTILRGAIPPSISSCDIHMLNCFLDIEWVQWDNRIKIAAISIRNIPEKMGHSHADAPK